MGIPHIMEFLEERAEIYRRVNIPDFMQQGQKVFVVDGDLYIEKCLSKYYYLLFVGGILEFTENIRIFVQAFQNLGAKLVFFFTDSFRELETQKSTYYWCKLRMRREKYKQKLLERFKNQQPLILSPKGLSKLQDITCWVISVLREMGCEVFCPDNYRLSRIVSYAQANNCFAILSQNTYYIFYVNLNCLYLSLDYLNLENMTTKMFNTELLASRLGLNKTLFPLLASLLSEDYELTSFERNTKRERILQNISTTPEDCPVTLTAAYIRENYDPLNLKNVPELLIKHFPENFNKIMRYYSKFKRILRVKKIRIESTKPDISTLSNWDKIKIKCRELSRKGKICGRIPLIVEKRLFQQFPSLEDFEDIPPSSLVYKNLRSKMYGILLHEAEDSVENLRVTEWCVEMVNQPCYSVEVFPSLVSQILHPGLLALWEDTCGDDVLTNRKWRLFAAAISPELYHRSLQDLPKFLVVPVAVLYYLYREGPKYSQDVSYNFATSWELEVLLIVTMAIRSIDLSFLRCLPNHKASIRVIRLTNLFIQGCDIIKMVLQSCGLNLGEKNTSICWNFDAKLFQFLYDKFQKLSPVEFSNLETFCKFYSIKNLIFKRQTP